MQEKRFPLLEKGTVVLSRGDGRGFPGRVAIRNSGEWVTTIMSGLVFLNQSKDVWTRYVVGDADPVSGLPPRPAELIQLDHCPGARINKDR